MEILTLLKANIRRKKGAFVSVLLLTAIVITLMTSIFSIRDNYKNGLNNALEYADRGDVVAFIATDSMTEDVRSQIENSELVERVQYYDAISAGKATVGNNTNGDSHFLMELSEGIKLFNKNADGFEETIPALKSGEIYLPYGLRSKLVCEVGDTITYECLDIVYKFTIKGFVQEPTQGALTMGWKQVFVSREDFQSIYNETKPLETEDNIMDFTAVMIHQSPDSVLSTPKFQRELNLETKIIDLSVGALNEAQSIRYSTLLPDVVTNIVIVFVVFLYVIVLIVMSHSVSTEIEIDYVDLGVLKAQGFSKWKIRAVMVLQYLVAQIMGAIIGILFALPIEQIISKLCQEITAVLPEKGFSVDKSLLCILGILVVSALLILIKTRKIAQISPIRAISGGREEIYFESRLNMPIAKKVLSSSIALRQFTSNKKRYIGTMFIIAILTYSMITVNLTGNLLSSRSAQEAMGLTIPDIEIYHKENVDANYFDEAEQIVAAHSEIIKKNDMYRCYATINGENLMCEMYKNPEYIAGIIKGREPIYANEVMITEMVADTLDLKMGDEVVVSFREEDEKFIISGFFQSQYDSGMSFAINFEGAEKVGIDTSYAYRHFVVKDKSKVKEITEEIDNKYGDIVGVYYYDEQEDGVESQYGMIVDALKVIIYSFSILFAFVVVLMVCNKTFIQERTDIGIYKAMGFTSTKLRLSFAVRFFIVALFGSALGTLLSILFSGKMLGMALSLIGLSKVVTNFTVTSVLVPIVVVSISFFIFAYLASGKIKSVSVRELTVE